MSTKQNRKTLGDKRERLTEPRATVIAAWIAFAGTLATAMSSCHSARQSERDADYAKKQAEISSRQLLTNSQRWDIFKPQTLETFQALDSAIGSIQKVRNRILKISFHQKVPDSERSLADGVNDIQAEHETHGSKLSKEEERQFHRAKNAAELAYGVAYRASLTNKPLLDDSDIAEIKKYRDEMEQYQNALRKHKDDRQKQFQN